LGEVGLRALTLGDGVEHATDGKILATEILNEANARKPIRLKSRGEEDSLFGHLWQGVTT